MHPTKAFAARPIATKPFAAVLLSFFLALACLAGPVEAARADTPAEPHGRAYLFRGLIGLIDWGMDQLAERITRTGVAATIDSHLVWRSIATQAINDYRRDPKPITVIGHSIGGDAAVEFAETLGAAHVPVALLVTYDPTRAAGRIPANVERYINLYQSSNFLGGGDLVPGGGFHGHYASYNLKDRPDVVHINMDKFDRIQELLTSKVRSAAAGSGRSEGEPVPLHIVFAATGPIELWDSGVPVTAHAGDTLQSIAAEYRVPVWAVAQINKKAEGAALGDGEHIVVPRYLGAKLPNLAASPATSPAGSPAPAAR
jgi:hypothetical protein